MIFIRNEPNFFLCYPAITSSQRYVPKKEPVPDIINMIKQPINGY